MLKIYQESNDQGFTIIILNIKAIIEVLKHEKI